MRTEILEEFVVWADSKTVESAARKLHISQSTLSKHLIALEDELGVNLVDRCGKGKLTPAGVRFYNGIIDVLDRLEKTVSESRRISSGNDYEIVVWDPFIFSGAMRELENILRDFLKSTSTPAHITLRNEAFKTAPEALMEGLVDVAIDYSPAQCAHQPEQSTSRFCLVEEPIVMWCKKTHPLASKERLSPHDLKGVPVMCSMELAHPLQSSIVELCEQRGFFPRFYRFNPTSQASFFFDALIECVYLFTPDLQNDERIRSRDDMIIKRFDDEKFAVRASAVVRNVEGNHVLGELCAFLSERCGED